MICRSAEHTRLSRATQWRLAMHTRLKNIRVIPASWLARSTRRRPRRVNPKLCSTCFEDVLASVCNKVGTSALAQRCFASNSRANLSMLTAMVRLILPSVLVSAIAVTSTMAMARSRHQNPPETYSPQTNFYHPPSDPNAVYAGGSYAGSDPDPNIQGALIREFGRRGI